VNAGKPAETDELFALFRTLSRSRLAWRITCQLAEDPATTHELAKALGPRPYEIAYQVAILKTDALVCGAVDDPSGYHTLQRERLEHLLTHALARNAPQVQRHAQANVGNL
jgi:hypothetical protein